MHFKDENSAGSAVRREWFSLVSTAFLEPHEGLLTSADGGRTVRPTALHPDDAAEDRCAASPALPLRRTLWTEMPTFLIHCLDRYVQAGPHPRTLPSLVKSAQSSSLQSLACYAALMLYVYAYPLFPLPCAYALSLWVSCLLRRLFLQGSELGGLLDAAAHSPCLPIPVVG